MKTTFRRHLLVPDQMIGPMIGQVNHDSIFLESGCLETRQHSANVIIIYADRVAMLSHDFAV